MGKTEMDITELEENFFQYLKYHVDDRDPRLVAFYMGEIFKECLVGVVEENGEKERYAEKRRADLVK